MKDTKHKILTLAALTTIAAGVIHLTNRVIVASSQLKEMLDFSNHNYYNCLLYTSDAAIRKNLLYQEGKRFSTSSYS